MAENGSELRGIAWTEALPFVRLFATLRLALNFNRLVLALACVVCCYAAGRVLDGLWAEGGGVAARLRGPGIQTEVEAYATRGHTEFVAWERAAEHERLELAAQALLRFRSNEVTGIEEARVRSAAVPLADLLFDTTFKQELDELSGVLDDALGAIDRDANLTDEERRQEREAVDLVRMLLTRTAPPRVLPDERALAIDTLGGWLPADAAEGSQAELRRRIESAVRRQEALQAQDRLRPRGPFFRLLQHEEHCFAAAIQGVCSGRWGFSGSAFDPEPAMAGSIESALRGICWLCNQRPWYAFFFAVVNLLVFAYFGGAICRSAAVQSARDESVSLGEALRFVRERYGGFLVAPLLPVAVFVGIALLMTVGGLVGAIGYVGELFTGVFYVLALLGGFALAFLLLAVVLGFHLMWPTIAVEGSDGFDALSRACSYVFSRIWHVIFYAFVLLLYGGVSFVLVRLVALLTLKLSHRCTGFGMNVISSAELQDVGKLDALWSMPAWADLPLLPSTLDLPFWGTFRNGPLDGFESVGAFFLALWIFLLVGLVGAFIVSYFFCGSTQMYFLLRRSVDATDYEEIYYEEEEEEEGEGEAPPVTGPVPEPTGAVPTTEPSPSEAAAPSEPPAADQADETSEPPPADKPDEEESKS